MYEYILDLLRRPMTMWQRWSRTSRASKSDRPAAPTEEAPVAEQCGTQAGIGSDGLLTRLAPLLVGAALLVVLTALVAAGLPLPFTGSPRAVGTELGATPAPDFRLTNQFGEEVALSDLRGKVVVLTFLYTSCPDTCPLTASKLGQVHDQLGERAREVAFVVVTVDPERDRVARVRQFLEAQRLSNKLLFLTGERPALEVVWAAYHIGVTRLPVASRSVGGDGFYEVGHTDVLYLIDRHGRMRRLMRSDFGVADLRRNLEMLLREPGGA